MQDWKANKGLGIPIIFYSFPKCILDYIKQFFKKDFTPIHTSTYPPIPDWPSYKNINLFFLQVLKVLLYWSVDQYYNVQKL